MRIGWIGGDQLRHLYYINRISEQFDVVGGIMQGREVMPTMSSLLPAEDQHNMTKHFWERKQADEWYFENTYTPRFPLLKVDKQTLNDIDSVEFIKKLNPDLVLVFGCGMIRDPLFSALPKDTINLHLGLSPRYRGAATLFWPQYFLEPNWVGTTFHYIVNTPDGGDIIHQCVPEMEKGDGIHDLACKAILKSTTEAIKLIKMYPNWKKYPQKPEAGKNFLESDFKPQHLRLIYETYDNKIVDRFLAGKIEKKDVKLLRQYE